MFLAERVDKIVLVSIGIDQILERRLYGFIRYSHFSKLLCWIPEYFSIVYRKYRLSTPANGQSVLAEALSGAQQLLSSAHEDEQWSCTTQRKILGAGCHSPHRSGFPALERYPPDSPAAVRLSGHRPVSQGRIQPSHRQSQTSPLKHRLARSLFLYALCNGWLREGSTVVEASSGSTAISEAYFARLLGLPFLAVMPSSTSTEKIAAIEFQGGRCHLIDDPVTIYSESQRLADQLGGHYMDQFTAGLRSAEVELRGAEGAAAITRRSRLRGHVREESPPSGGGRRSTVPAIRCQPKTRS
jgi:hypothetical protein